MMTTVVEGQPPCSLTQNFVKVSTSGEFTECRPCPDCPEDHGLNIQCGSSITDDTMIECVLRCRIGVQLHSFIHLASQNHWESSSFYENVKIYLLSINQDRIYLKGGIEEIKNEVRYVK